MNDNECVALLQWALPRLHMRWRGFRKVRKQVCKRISRRMTDLNLADTQAYLGFLETHPREWERLDTFCRITISRFYRDRSVFDCLGREVLPALARVAADAGRSKVRCWCIGCASGEEAYTLRMVWLHNVSRLPERVGLHILATDIVPIMLDRAHRGCYTMGSLKDLPGDWLEQDFDLTDGLYRIRDHLRTSIEFRLQDIRREQPEGPFDIILCRNLVFTYFDQDLQSKILEALLDRLDPLGVLVAGKQEPLPPTAATLVETREHTGVYRAEMRGRHDPVSTAGG